MNIFLETPRLLLRDFVPEDAEFIQNLDSDPEVMRYLTNGIPSNRKEVARVMSIFLNSKIQYQGKMGYWIVIEKSSNEVFGWFHLRPLKEEPENFKKLELGYRFQKSHWGKGYATEGSRALIERAKELQIEEIWAHTMSKNAASINVMKKCGLEFSYDDIYEPFPGEDKSCVWYKMVL